MTKAIVEKLTDAEIERYARQIILPEIGGSGQQKLKAARILMIGAGGLGAPVLIYLAAAGIGTLGIVDDDIVSLSNLHRQIIHTTKALNTLKVDSAQNTIEAINPHVLVEKHACRLTQDNAQTLIANYDIIVDGSDNFTTRYLVADVAEKLHKPLVTSAIGRFDGSLTVLMPYQNNNPNYRDLFPTPPPKGTIANCQETGVIGVLPGIMGALQAMEVIKLITDIGKPLIGRLLLYDGLNANFDIINYKRKKNKGER